MGSLGSLIVTIGADISDFVGAIGEATSALSDFAAAPGDFVGSLVGGFGDVVQGALGLAEGIGVAYFRLQGFGFMVKAVGQALFGQNAAMEQAAVAFTTLTGSAQKANAFLTQLYSFAARTPFLFPDLVTAAQRMMAFGISVNQVIPDLRAMGDAISAFGGSSTQLNVIINSFGKIEAAGHVTQAALYEMERIGIPALKFLADGMHVTQQQAQEMVHKGLIPAKEGVQVLLNEFEKFYGGAMAKQALTFNGLMTTLADNIRFAWMAFAGPMFDAAKQGLLQLVVLTSSPAFQNFAKTMGGAMSSALASVGSLISGVVVPAFRAVAAVVQAIWPVLQNVATVIGGALHVAFAIIGSEISNQFLPALQNVAVLVGSSVGPALKALGPILMQIASFIGGQIVQHAQLFVAVLQIISQIIYQLVIPALTGFMQIISQVGGFIGSTILPALTQLGNAVTNSLTKAFGQAASTLPQFLVGLQGVASNIRSGIQPALQLAGQALQQFENFLRQTGTVIASTIGPALQNLGNTIRPLLPILAGTGMAALKAGGEFVQWAVHSGALKGVLDGIRTAIAAVSAIIAALINSLSGVIHFFTQTTLGTTLLQGALVALGGFLLALAATALAGLIVGLAGAVAGFVTAAAGAITLAAPIIGLIAGAIALGAALVAVFRNSEPLRAALAGLGGVIQDIWKMVAVPVWNTLVQAWNQIKSSLATLQPALANLWQSLQALAPAGKALAEILGAVLVLALGLVVGAIFGVITALGALIRGVILIVTGIIQFFTGLITFLSGAISFIVDLITGHFDRLGNDLRTMWLGIQNMLAGVWKAIQGIITATIGTILGLIGGFIQGIISFFEHMASVLVGHSIVPDMMNAILNVFQNAFHLIVAAVTQAIAMIIQIFVSLQSNITNAVNNIRNALVAGFNNAKNAVVGIVQGMAATVQNIIAGIGNAIGGLINAAGNAASTVGGILNNVHIPGFAEGVQNFSGGLAIVGERGPELVNLPRGSSVLNNDDTQAFLSGLGGGGDASQLAIGIGGTSSQSIPQYNGITETQMQQLMNAFLSALGAASSPVLQVDGRELARVTGPYLAQEKRAKLGIRSSQ